MGLDGLEAEVADIVFDPAGVFSGGGLVDAEVHQQPGEDGMPLVIFDLFARCKKALDKLAAANYNMGG